MAPINGNQYEPADDNSIYAAAFLLNKIICILTCTFDTDKPKNKECYNITNYRLVGPKNMVCTQYNILFVLHISDAHYETFYPDNERCMDDPQYFIKPRLVIVDNLNTLIITQRQIRIDAKLTGLIPPPFDDYFEYYEFTSTDIPIDLTQSSNVESLESLKSKVTTKLNDSEELSDIETYIKEINPRETNVDTLYNNEALLARLIKENQELTEIINIPNIPEEDTRPYNVMSQKLTQLISILVNKTSLPSPPLLPPLPLSPLLPPLLPSSPSTPSPPPSPSMPPLLPPSPSPPPLPPLPTSSNNPSSSSTPKVSTTKKYSFYSKPRPVLNLPLTSTIQYTPYILRDRIRKTLILNPLIE